MEQKSPIKNLFLHQPNISCMMSCLLTVLCLQERQKVTGGRGTQQKKGGKSIILSDGEQRGLFPPASSLRFPAPPPPVVNANLPRGPFSFYASHRC